MINRLAQQIYYRCPVLLQDIALNIYGYWQAKRRFGGEFSAILEGLERSQWLSPSELEDLQNRCLQQLIVHAYENVPYYRRIFEERGLKPHDIRTKEDLVKLPFLTKGLIRKNFRALLAVNIPSSASTPFSTSGSTGQKLKFYTDRRLRWEYNYATLYRFYRWAGFDAGERRVTIAGRFFTNRPPYWRFNRWENQLLLSTHHLDSRTVDLYLDQIERFSPEAIQGHPSAVYYLAKRLAEQGRVLPVQTVLTTGEQLFSDQRELIEDRFQCRVFDAWGQAEMVAMAGECEKHKGYHVASEYGIVEVVKNELGRDDLGEIVATSLQNYSMPFIRYRTGDLGAFADRSCPCGRGLPLLGELEGRVDDALLAPDGHIVLPVAFRTSFAKLEYLDQYQLIQKDRAYYQMLVLKDRPLTYAEGRGIMRVLRYYLGSSAEIEIKSVSQIPRTPRAKQRLILREVPITPLRGKRR